MPRNAIAFRILIASPSDVGKEREILADAIDRWNASHSVATGIVLEAIRWETHAHPAAGEHPQAIINAQIVDDCDIVVGVFWSRIGTATPGAVSGTVEEIERLRQRGKQVLLYFSSADLPQHHDSVQFKSLQDYKQTLRDRALYWEFDSPEKLDQLFSGHLATVVNELKKKLDVKHGPTTERAINLVSLNPLGAPRYLKPDDSDTWREVSARERQSFLGAIAIFRNEPVAGLPSNTIKSLRAQITFYESDGGEVQRVHHGCWLREPFNFTRLSTSGTKELIIAVEPPDSISPCAIENTRSKAAEWELEGTIEKPLERRLYDVNVRLIGRTDEDMDVVVDFHFNLDLRGERPILKREWTR
jgi:hypothetical protein